MHKANAGAHENQRLNLSRARAAHTKKDSGIPKSLLARGAEGRSRTADAGIFSPSLYRLSYLGSTESPHISQVLEACQSIIFDPSKSSAINGKELLRDSVK